MTKLNKLSLIILSYLQSQGKESGYKFNKHTNAFWSNTHQSVYRELNSLLNKKLVTFETVENEEKPDSKVFSITKLGIKTLNWNNSQPLEFDSTAVKTSALAQILSSQPGPDFEVMVKRYMHTLDMFFSQYSDLREHYQKQLLESPDCYLTQNLAIYFARQYHSVKSEIEFLNEIINYKG